MHDVPGIYDALRRALGTGGWWAVQAVHDGTDLQDIGRETIVYPA